MHPASQPLILALPLVTDPVESYFPIIGHAGQASRRRFETWKLFRFKPDKRRTSPD